MVISLTCTAIFSSISHPCPMADALLDGRLGVCAVMMCAAMLLAIFTLSDTEIIVAATLAVALEFVAGAA